MSTPKSKSRYMLTISVPNLSFARPFKKLTVVLLLSLKYLLPLPSKALHTPLSPSLNVALSVSSSSAAAAFPARWTHAPSRQYSSNASCRADTDGSKT